MAAADTAAKAASTAGNAAMSAGKTAWKVATSGKTWAALGIIFIACTAAAPAAVAAATTNVTTAASLTEIFRNSGAVLMTAFKTGGPELLHAGANSLQWGAAHASALAAKASGMPAAAIGA